MNKNKKINKKIKTFKFDMTVIIIYFQQFKSIYMKLS